MNDPVYLDAFLVIHLFVPAFSNCCQNFFLILLTFSMNSESILNILLQMTSGNTAYLYIAHSLRPTARHYTNTSSPPYASTPLLPHRPVCAVNNESLRLSNLGGQSILEPKQNKTKFTTIKPTASKQIIFWTGSIWQVLECFTYLDEQLGVPSS